MGAALDSGHGVGKTFAEAWDDIVKRREFSDGHGGYSGTFAEKPGAQLVHVPAKFNVEKFIRLINEGGDFGDMAMVYEDIKEARRRNTRKNGTLNKSAFNREAKYLLDTVKQFDRWVKRCGAAADAAQTFVMIADGDKWGPAAAVELTGSALWKWKKAHPEHKGKRGLRVFYFVGMCSS